MNKKILLISNNGSGFYHFKRELVKELLDFNYDVFFAVPYYKKLKEIEVNGAHYEEIKIDRRGVNPIKDLGLMINLYKVMQRIKPDIVILHTIKPNIYGSFICNLYKIPYINNITGLGSALQKSGFLAKLLRLMYRFTLKKSSAIFFENKGNCEYFKKYTIGNEKVYHIVSGAGVNTNYFDANSYLDDNNKRNKEHNIIFLFIGRLMQEKGIGEYLRAASIIKKKYSNVEFNILGEYEEEKYKEELKDLEKQGVISYLGISEDTRREMLQADCIVLPSYHEGMSNVLLEGASFGLPIITTNIHGCKEAVEDGVTGFLCEPKDEKTLIEAMENLLNLTSEQRKTMGWLGRRKMLSEFNREQVVGTYVSVIRNII